MERAAYLFIAVVLLFLTASCAGTGSPDAAGTADRLATVATATAVSGTAYRETCISSWNGSGFTGTRPASGGTPDRTVNAGAHRTLPLGTTIQVTNLDTFKTVSLTVTERGPLARSRCLEVSYGAALELGFASQGTARVRIETDTPVAQGGIFTVQAAVFSEEENAGVLKERLNRRFESVAIVPFETAAGRFYKVRVGAYGSEEKAERIAAKLALEGLEPVVMRKDP